MPRDVSSDPKCLRCHRRTDLQLYPLGFYLCTQCSANSTVTYCPFCETFYEQKNTVVVRYLHQLVCVCDSCSSQYLETISCVVCELEVKVNIENKISTGPNVQEVHSREFIPFYLYFERSWLCKACVAYNQPCNECREIKLKTNLKTAYDSQERMCDSCLRIRFSRCKYCKHYYKEECDCYKHAIQSYHASPYFYPGLIPSQRYSHELLLFGLENELSVPNAHLAKRAAVHLRRTDPWAICKSDASIRPTGFEVVTRPATYEWWMSQESAVNRYFGLAKYWNCEANYSCGMHLHLTRKAFVSEKHVYTFYRLVYFYPFVWVKLSKRPKDKISWLGEYSKIFNMDLTTSVLRAIGTGTQTINRHHALVTRTSTIEFRIFSGTLNGSDILARIELVKSLFEFSKKSKTEPKISDWFEYVEQKGFQRAFRYIEEANIQPDDITDKPGRFIPSTRTNTGEQETSTPSSPFDSPERIDFSRDEIEISSERVICGHCGRAYNPELGFDSFYCSVECHGNGTNNHLRYCEYCEEAYLLENGVESSFCSTSSFENASDVEDDEDDPIYGADVLFQ